MCNATHTLWIVCAWLCIISILWFFNSFKQHVLGFANKQNILQWIYIVQRNTRYGCQPMANTATHLLFGLGRIVACCINENQLAEPTSDSIIKIEYSNKKNWIVIDKCLATKYLKKERNFVNAGHKILAINYVKWWNSMICNNKHLM